MFMDKVEELVKLAKEMLKEYYNEHKIIITGIHIEKIAGKDEYTVTINFNAIRDTREGKIVIEQKLVMTNNMTKFVKENKYIF